MVSLSPPPVFCVIGDIKGWGWGWGQKLEGNIFPILCWHVFSSTCILPSLVLKAKVACFPVARFLIPLCIPELLVIFVYTMKGSIARGLCTYCQVSQGVLQLKYYFGQKESKKARKDEKERNSVAQGKCWNITQASFFHRCVICISPSTFFPCLLPHTMHLSFISEKAMTTHSSTLAWKIPWMEEPGRLQSMRSLRVEHDWATSLSLFTFMHWRGKWQPTPVFLPGESQGQQSLVGCRLWGRTESDTTQAT